MADMSTFNPTPESDELHYRTLFVSSLDAVLLASPDGSIQDANPAACQMFGRSKGELRELGRSSIMDSSDPRLAIALQLRAQTGKFFGELTGLRKDGSKFPIELSTSLYQEKNDAPHTCVIIRDISERKRMEESLKFQSKVVENIAEGVNLARVSDGTIVYANPSFSKMFGYDPGEIIGQNISIVNSPGEKTPEETAQEIMSILLEKGGWSGEVMNIKKNGEKFWCSVSISAIEHYLYGPVWISLHTDITKGKEAELELKAREKALQELNSTKDKFFSIIAHDLKSPFNAILGFSNILKEQIATKDYDGIEEYAGIIHNSAVKAMDLLENLLEWSRLQTGKMNFNPEFIDIVAKIIEVTELFKDSAEQKGISLQLELPASLYVMADQPMTCSILRNLLSNAIKFTRSCGRIVIEAKQIEDEIVITVKDNGVGIPKENIQKLFRMDESFTTNGTLKEKGSGLGLILVKEFIEKHGGKIFVESEPGIGSSFYFSIPT